jgi:hypothetical protein
MLCIKVYIYEYLIQAEILKLDQKRQNLTEYDQTLCMITKLKYHYWLWYKWYLYVEPINVLTAAPAVNYWWRNQQRSELKIRKPIKCCELRCKFEKREKRVERLSLLSVIWKLIELNKRLRVKLVSLHKIPFVPSRKV